MAGDGKGISCAYQEGWMGQFKVVQKRCFLSSWKSDYE